MSPRLTFLPGSYFARDYDSYRFLLCSTPLQTQAVLGLVVTIVVGVTTAIPALAWSSRRWWLIAARAIFGWACLYALLPFHLSAPDFDDVFVVDKLACAIEPDWNSNKPLFSVFDFVYRTTTLFGFGSDPFIGFAINGWFLVLYEVNLLVILRRSVGDRVRDALGSRAATMAVVLAAANFGLLLLSHTLAYELAGATFVLGALNLVEFVREGRTLRHVHALILLSLCSFGIVLQRASYPQFSAAWMIVCLHAVMTLWQLRAPRHTIVLGAALVGASMGAFLLAEHNEVMTVFLGGRWTAGAVSVVIALLAAVLWVGRWALRSGLVERWRSDPHNSASTQSVLLLYGSAGLGLFLLPNQLNINPFDTHWLFAENHARYSALAYPFIACGLGWFACRLAESRSRIRALGAIALAYGIWNLPYVASFYLPWFPDYRQFDAGSVFQRNMRPIANLDRELPRALDAPVLYLPIPRDHGDHYLVRAARPAAAVASACDPRTRRAGMLLVVSRNTLSVWQEEFPSPSARPALPVRGGYRDLRDRSWEVQVFARDRIDERALERWCGALEAAWDRQYLGGPGSKGPSRSERGPDQRR